MKRTISLLFWFLPFFLTSISLDAATTVSANLVSDTQWNQAGNPYLISGNISVPQGVMLSIGSGVQVVFQGSAQLEVAGTLLVNGSAAYPAVFNMTQGGLQSKFFLNGGTANISNAKFVGGIFLAKDSQFNLEGSELTQGSGLYLQGINTAKIKSCKIYGNATGLVSDGKNKITMTFNTIVQNTYGLFLKSFGELDFRNNSIHDNQVEVINNTPPYKLGDNFWGSLDEKVVMSKIQGGIDLKPMKSLKDVLRVYVQTQLPEITQEMSDAMAAKERREEKAEKLALKKLKEQEGLEALNAKRAQEKGQTATVSAPPAVPQPEQAAVSASPAVNQPAASQPEEAIAPELESTASSGTIKVKALPAAPHQLTPVALPPDLGNLAGVPSAAPPPGAASPAAVASSPAAAPEIPASTGVPASTEIPVIPDSELMPPPPPSVEAAPLPSVNAPVASTQPAPDVNNASPASTASTDNGEIPPPPGTESSANAAPSVPPPPPSATAASNAPSGTTSTSPTENEQLPPPPPVESNTNVPSPEEPAIPSMDTIPNVPSPAAAAPLAPAAPAAVAPPPSAEANDNVPPPPAATTAQSVPTTDQPTTDQKKAADALQGVNGDIDGMQAPPLDLGVGSSSPTTGSAPAPDTTKQPSDDSTLALPPLQDSEVKPPKDLDLPPTDDLGNVNLDSRNK